MKERRTSRRIETPKNIVAIEQHSIKGYGDLCDISRGGVRVQSNEKVQVGIISLMFKLPQAKEALTVDGIVGAIQKS